MSSCSTTLEGWFGALQVLGELLQAWVGFAHAWNGLVIRQGTAACEPAELIHFPSRGRVTPGVHACVLLCTPSHYSTAQAAPTQSSTRRTSPWWPPRAAPAGQGMHRVAGCRWVHEQGAGRQLPTVEARANWDEGQGQGQGLGQGLNWEPHQQLAWGHGRTSGALYSTVPSTLDACCSLMNSQMWARPRSATFTSKRAVTSRLAVFRSRWMICWHVCEGSVSACARACACVMCVVCVCVCLCVWVCECVRAPACE